MENYGQEFINTSDFISKEKSQPKGIDHVSLNTEEETREEKFACAVRDGKIRNTSIKLGDLRVQEGLEEIISAEVRLRERAAQIFKKLNDSKKIIDHETEEELTRRFNQDVDGILKIQENDLILSTKNQIDVSGSGDEEKEFQKSIEVSEASIMAQNAALRRKCQEKLKDLETQVEVRLLEDLDKSIMVKRYLLIGLTEERKARIKPEGASMTIQRYTRGFMCRLELKSVQETISCFRTILPNKIHRSTYCQVYKTLFHLEGQGRSLSILDRAAKMVKAAMMIQKIWRGTMVKQDAKIKAANVAATRLQATWRMYQGGKTYQKALGSKYKLPQLQDLTIISQCSSLAMQDLASSFDSADDAFANLMAEEQHAIALIAREAEEALQQAMEDATLRKKNRPPKIVLMDGTVRELNVSPSQVPIFDLQRAAKNVGKKRQHPN